MRAHFAYSPISIRGLLHAHPKRKHNSRLPDIIRGDRTPLESSEVFHRIMTGNGFERCVYGVGDDLVLTALQG